MEIAERIGITLETFYSLPEAERAEWVAKWEVERDTCKFHGGPVSECADDERDWFPQLVVCQPSMQLEAAKRRFALLHEERPYHDGTMTLWSDKPSPSYPFHYTDGVSIFLAEKDYGLGGDFLGQGLPLGESADEQEQASDHE